MKAQTKDAVAMAMDWLAQLREEDGAERSPGGNKPAIDSAPAAADSGDVPPAAPSASDWGDAAPATPSASDWGDAAPPAPSASDWGDAAPPARPTIDWGDAAPAVLPAVAWGSARPAAPPAGDFGDAAPAMPRAADFRPAAAPPAIDWDDVSLVAPPTSDFGDATPATPPGADWEHAAPPAPPETTPPGRAGAKADIEITERAAIGDELRIPLAWCEMGSCISHYTDPAALGEADIRARAIAAGWRIDALGRLACPQCQQGDCLFWTAHPVTLWDRDRAVAMTALMARAAALGAEYGASLDGQAGWVPGGRAPAVPGPRPEMARQPGRGRHRGDPAYPDRVL